MNCNQVVTVYHHEIKNNADTYKKTVLKGVYLHGENGISINGAGITETANKVINIPKALTDTYGKWTIENGDRFIEGVGENITSFKDIPNAFTVFSIDIYRIGSPIDNIVVKGK